MPHNLLLSIEYGLLFLVWSLINNVKKLWKWDWITAWGTQKVQNCQVILTK